jgi:hypothetical protein
MEFDRYKRTKMTRISKNKYRRIEIILVLMMWLVLIVSPLLSHGENEFVRWEPWLKGLEMAVPLLFVFLINRFLLVPYFFMKKKRILYFVAVIGLIFTVTFAYSIFHQQNRAHLTPERSSIEWLEGAPPHPQSMHPRPFPDRPMPMPPYINLFIFSVLFVGFDTGLKISLKSLELEKEKEMLQKENVSNQLNMLRHQVSPHFFMNTLNNIHSLIDYNAEIAKESIIALSKLMRHVLYDSQIEKISLKKEMEFIENYVELMRLRNSERIKINLDIPPELPNIHIPPLLFTSFIENAFKYGISYQIVSYIDIRFKLLDQRLIFTIRNSKPKKVTQDGHVGIGIENARKRLELIYGNRFTLHISDLENEFIVTLTIPL